MVRIATEDSLLSADVLVLKLVGGGTVQAVGAPGEIVVTLPGGAAGVSTFNTRNGTVTLQAADLTALMTRLAAADASVVVAGTTLAPTIKTATLDVIAATDPPAANWSNNGKKITNVAQGTLGTDVATVNQILANPMTTLGDIIYAAAGGAATRLPIGSAGMLLQIVSGLPSWQTVSIPVQLTPTAVKTANYNVGPGEYAVFNANGNYNAVLPTAPADKTTCAVAVVAHSGTNAITVQTGGTDVFNVAGGPASIVMNTLNQVLIAQYSSAAGIWYLQVVPAGTQRVPKRVSSTAGPGGTPSMNTDSFDVFHFTALAAAITSMTTNLTGTPVDGDALRVSFTDNGTARTITWGAGFEASTVALPTTTVASTRLDVGFFYNTETSKWRCVAVA